MKYPVTTRFIFAGRFFVEAESKAEAKQYVENHCGLVMGRNIHSTIPGEDVDWDFPVHPEKIIGGRRRQYI